MDKGKGVDLICLIDPDSSVRVRILGRNRIGDTPYNDHLDAELVITSAFANGRLGLCLSPEVIDDWSTALDEFSDRQDIRWTATGDTEIRIEIDRQFSVPRPIVTVDDSGENIHPSLWRQCAAVEGIHPRDHQARRIKAQEEQHFAPCSSGRTDGVGQSSGAVST
ncbi:DUF5959 family protein [Streptomyces sp. NPDC021080]|uniref:DUF5959 family protein n=1 Tax=Streptomyces sp. NPDC021080 TaxID=3365110 RepID=UPI00378F1935